MKNEYEIEGLSDPFKDNNAYEVYKKKKIHPLVKTDYVFIHSRDKFLKYLPEILSMPYWSLDVETTGIDPFLDKVILLQIGNYQKQYLVDTRDVSISELKSKLEDPNFKKIGQNLAFEYKMIKGTFGFSCEGLRDLMLAEILCTCGYQHSGFSLEDLSMKYLEHALDKEMQTSFIGHTGPFSLAQKEYAALDVVVPDLIMPKIIEELQYFNLINTWKLECDSIPAFGDIEFYGLNLDKKMWLDNIEKAEELLRLELEKFYKITSRYVNTDLFGSGSINPNSSLQIKNLFIELFGVENLIDGKGKVSTGDEILIKLISKFPDHSDLLKCIQNIRGIEKNVGTYGHSYLNHIHPKTGRFHPRISQIGSETGRPAGKKPSLLNIPAVKEYRTPWGNVPGRKILTNDYGACELRIMSSMSKDPVMCKGFNEGLDYHTYTVTQFIVDPEPWLREFIPDKKGEPGKGSLGKEILDGKTGSKIPNPNFNKLVPYDRVLKNHRSVAKTINFGLAYGMGAKKLSDDLRIPLDIGKGYVSQFNTKFIALVTWLRTNQDNSLLPRFATYEERKSAREENRPIENNLGYAETYLGRKRFFKIPRKPKPVEFARCYKKLDYWEDKIKHTVYKAEGLPTLKYDPNNPWDENMPKEVKNYYTRIASIKREGGNSPIQGGNADITKIAMIRLRNRIKQIEKERNNGEYLAHVALQVYDEIIIDCPDFLAEELREIMDHEMKEAGKEVIKFVPVEASAVVADYWTKD